MFGSEESDGGRCGVSDAGVCGFLHEVLVVSDAFDRAGVGAFAAGWVECAACGELDGGPGGRGGHLLRGKIALYRWRYGARCVRL